MLKRISISLVVLALFVSLTLISFTGSALAEGYKIGFSNYSVTNSWRVQMEAEFKAMAKKLQEEGVVEDFYMTNANGSIAKQISDVNDLITKGVDALLITAASPKALSPVCEKAEQQGVKVIAFDNVVSTDNITSKVGLNEVEFGRVGAKWLVDKLNGQGDIMILNGVAGTSVNADRWQGAKEVFDQFAGIKILGKANAAWDYAQGKTATENFLSAYSDIDGVWSQGGAMTEGAIDAFNAAGRELVPMSGEGNNGMLKAWNKFKEDGFSSIAPVSPTYQSSEALKVAIKALNGEDVKARYNLDIPVILDSNLEDYVRPDLPDSFWCVTSLTDEQINEYLYND